MLCKHSLQRRPKRAVVYLFHHHSPLQTLFFPILESHHIVTIVFLLSLQTPSQTFNTLTYKKINHVKGITFSHGLHRKLIS